MNYYFRVGDNNLMILVVRSKIKIRSGLSFCYSKEKIITYKKCFKNKTLTVSLYPIKIKIHVLCFNLNYYLI